MAQKQTKSAALPGVFATLGNGFELTTRDLWLIVIPAILDVFLWIGPRLSFRPLIESLSAQLPPQPMLVDVMPLLEMFATRLNHFTYLSVSLLGVPALSVDCPHGPGDILEGLDPRALLPLDQLEVLPQRLYDVALHPYPIPEYVVQRYCLDRIVDQYLALAEPPAHRDVSPKTVTAMLT